MEEIWRKFRHSLPGRLFAAVLIAAPIGAFAGAEVAPGASVIVFSALGAAVIGVLAVLVLEVRDFDRRRNSEWQHRIEEDARRLQMENPEAPAPLVHQVAKECREERLGPIAWCGMILGGFCVLCWLCMCVVKIIRLLKLLK